MRGRKRKLARIKIADSLAVSRLRSQGWKIYEDRRTRKFVAQKGKSMFIFDRISSRTVNEFLKWVSANKKAAFPLPKGVKHIWVRNPRHSTIPLAPAQSAAPSKVTRPAAYGLTLIEGSHSTVPGHLAELDWNDLRKR